MHIGGAAVKAVSRVADPEDGGQVGAIGTAAVVVVVDEAALLLVFGAALVEDEFFETK